MALKSLMMADDECDPIGGGAAEIESRVLFPLAAFNLK